MDLANTHIRTERLTLVPINESYAQTIFEVFTPAVTEYMFPAPAKEIGETLAFIRSSMQRLSDGTDLVMVILRDGEFCGCAGLHRIHTATPEFGIWIKSSVHGNGYGYEAVCGLYDWAREHLAYDHLLYPVDEENFPSRRIPEKLGGTIIGRKEMKAMSGKILYLVEYAIE